MVCVAPVFSDFSHEIYKIFKLHDRSIKAVHTHIHTLILFDVDTCLLKFSWNSGDIEENIFAKLRKKMNPYKFLNRILIMGWNHLLLC
jgi:hypothetical protein